MLPIAEIDPLASAAVTAILGGGGFTAWRVARTAGRESESIAARTLIEVNEELRKELDRKDRIIDQLEKRMAHMRKEMESLEQDIAALRVSNV